MPPQQAQRPMPPQQAQRQPPQQTQRQAPQQRATPFRRTNKPPRQVQRPSPPPQQESKKVSKPPSRNSFMQQQKNRLRNKNKKVRFKEEVEERFISNESNSDDETESDSEDTTPIEEIVLKSKSKKEKRNASRELKKSRESKELTKPKFLKKDDVKDSDLNETKGFYSKAISFFTNDTKEPLLVLALVFAISMPVVNKLMTRFLPFVMKYGEDSLFVVGVKALVVALVFFSVKKLLL